MRATGVKRLIAIYLALMSIPLAIAGYTMLQPAQIGDISTARAITRADVECRSDAIIVKHGMYKAVLSDIIAMCPDLPLGPIDFSGSSVAERSVADCDKGSCEESIVVKDGPDNQNVWCFANGKRWGEGGSICHSSEAERRPLMCFASTGCQIPPEWKPATQRLPEMLCMGHQDEVTDVGPGGKCVHSR